MTHVRTTAQSQYIGLYRTGAIAAFAMLAIMLAQVAIFIIWPPPATVEGFFQLFEQSELLGLLSLDFLYIINNTLLVLIYLALYTALKPYAPSAVLIALILGLAGITAYYASNTCYEMMSLAAQYNSTADATQKSIFLGAGQALLETYRGTAFDIYYVLNAMTLLIFAVIMLRSREFSRTTSVFGIIAGVLMTIPSTVGIIGLIFSLASLIPWAVFSLMTGIRLLKFQ
jgi:hypothetical protein